MEDFKKIFEDSLNEPTLTRVERDGKLLINMRTGYGSEYELNGPGWLEGYLYLYNNRKYVVIYRSTDRPFAAKECVKFEIMQ